MPLDFWFIIFSLLNPGSAGPMGQIRSSGRHLATPRIQRLATAPVVPTRVTFALALYTVAGAHNMEPVVKVQCGSTAPQGHAPLGGSTVA